VNTQPIGSRIALDNAAPWTAQQLAAPWPTLSCDITCAQVFNWLEEHLDQPAVAVVDENDTVVGLVNRILFLSNYARRYYPELYGRRPILALANRSPLIVDEMTGVAELGAALVFENPAALIECFVVTSNGRYLGIGTGEALMRSKVALLQAREHELSRAVVDAREASRAKSNFLALMSHELRTPLNAIIGFSEIVSTEIFGPLGNTKYGDILDVSKAEAGKLDLYVEAVSLPDVIAECVKLLTVRAQEGRLKLSVATYDDLPSVMGDQMRLKQIVLNLLSNAVKFTPAGGHVTIGAQHTATGGVDIFVRDTGIGMAPEQIPVALEPFRQIGSAHARQFEGTGLGLSLVKSLVELHNGELFIESALNAGTTVRARFPAARCALANPQFLRMR
jgi:two-component system cell cycle sensor histidine kinase PleC